MNLDPYLRNRPFAVLWTEFTLAGGSVCVHKKYIQYVTVQSVNLRCIQMFLHRIQKYTDRERLRCT